MSAFDWETFFRQHAIDYRTSGPNTSRGQLVTRCVWCGVSDPSMHLSVSLEGHGFRCWRHPEHRGKNPAKLIQALLNCSWERACSLAGVDLVLTDNFLSRVKAQLDDNEIATVNKTKLKLPHNFYRIENKPSAKLYINYLRSRRFKDSDILTATDNFGIYYCTQGPFKGRIIFTVVFEGVLCGWTGRTVYDIVQQRYKTLSNDLEKAHEEGFDPAPNPISHYLLWYDRVVSADADTIFLSEGPFDAWRLNLLGKRLGVVATCFFTSTLSRVQLQLLHEILPKFKNRYLLLDANTMTKALHIKSDLLSLSVTIKYLPSQFKDPAEMQTEKDLEILL